MVSTLFMERQFVKAGLVKGSGDDTQFQFGMEIIKKQPKLLMSTKAEMIQILRDFIGI